MIPNKVYNILKYIAQVGLPALAVFLSTVLGAWDVSDDTVFKTVTTTVALNTLLGALLVISTAKYNASDQKYDGTIDPYYANGALSNAALHIPDMERALEVEDPSFTKKDVLLKVIPQSHYRE